ncbi:MAG: gamma-glutamyl-gamma-aminobutyrate hydrolase family protein [Phycisphaeraceae bacterium]
MLPIIGITLDNKDNTATSGVYECGIAYSAAVARAGGLPVLLPHEVELVPRYLELCDGFILTGGVDPRMEQFGEATDARARKMDEKRQAFELALLAALQPAKEKAVLGVCLGMQLMTLQAGGRLNQYLPDTLKTPEVHQKCNRHVVQVIEASSAAYGQDARTVELAKQDTVVSAHRQAMATTGRLRLIAKAADDVIEAVDDPTRPFYVGVQWHPERGGEGVLSQGLIDRLVAASSRSSR